jgi:gamma-glutamylcyclotransferase (GGCT)/AIG2-like uncharacterized protein YtfP
MKPDMDLALFVYGSLMPGGRHWKRYCEHRVAELQPAQVRGRLYKLSDGYLALGEPAGQAEDPWVRGWRLVLHSVGVLHSIDRLEDFAEGRASEENAYLRTRVACFAEDGQTVLGEAWVYTMTPTRLAFEGAVEAAPT